MNIESLKCFILVAENLSFARAAQALYITQPAVTKQINSLERTLGVPLFIRSTRHVELTSAGMSFYKDAKDLVQSAQTAIERAQRQYAMSDVVGIGLSTPALLPHLTPLFARFHAACPGIRPNFHIHPYPEILNLFLDNRLDLLFSYQKNTALQAGIYFLELEEDFFCCLTAQGHPLSKQKSVCAEDLAGETIIICNSMSVPSSAISFQQKLLGLRPSQQLLYHSSVEVTHCMVASRMGISILPRILCPNTPEFSTIPLTNSPKLTFGVICHKQNINTALSQFLKFLKEPNEAESN